jgi:hypothetical protein
MSKDLFAASMSELCEILSALVYSRENLARVATTLGISDEEMEPRRMIAAIREQILFSEDPQEVLWAAIHCAKAEKAAIEDERVEVWWKSILNDEVGTTEPLCAFEFKAHPRYTTSYKHLLADAMAQGSDVRGNAIAASQLALEATEIVALVLCKLREPALEQQRRSIVQHVPTAASKGAAQEAANFTSVYDDASDEEKLYSLLVSAEVLLIDCTMLPLNYIHCGGTRDGAIHTVLTIHCIAGTGAGAATLLYTILTIHCISGTGAGAAALWVQPGCSGLSHVHVRPAGVYR